MGEQLCILSIIKGYIVIRYTSREHTKQSTNSINFRLQPFLIIFKSVLLWIRDLALSKMSAILNSTPSQTVVVVAAGEGVFAAETVERVVAGKTDHVVALFRASAVVVTRGAEESRHWGLLLRMRLGLACQSRARGTPPAAWRFTAMSFP